MPRKQHILNESRTLRKLVNYDPEHIIGALYAPLVVPGGSTLKEDTFTDDPSLGANEVGDTLPKLTPLYMKVLSATERGWAPWEDGQIIGAFALGRDSYGSHEDRALKLDPTLLVDGNVLMGGTLQFELIPVPKGQTSDNLKSALIDGMRSKNFDILGIAGVS